jgi:hypothetical protein
MHRAFNIVRKSRIVVADRTPPYGGIARPKGKHSRHKAVFCLPIVDVSTKIERNDRCIPDANPEGLRPPQAPPGPPLTFQQELYSTTDE